MFCTIFPSHFLRIVTCFQKLAHNHFFRYHRLSPYTTITALILVHVYNPKNLIHVGQLHLLIDGMNRLQRAV